MNQIILEVLNAALYDLTKGEPSDGIEAIEEAIQLLEQQGEKMSSLHAFGASA